MSDELKLELEQCKNQITGMNAALAAAKEMIGENQTTIHTLKTNLSLYAKAHNDLVQDNARLQAQVAVLSAQVLELQPKEDNGAVLDHLVPENLNADAA